MPVQPNLPAPDIHVSRMLSYVRTILDDHDTVDDLYLGGKPPLSGGGANGIPLGHLIGQVHHRYHPGVWYATPDTGTWADARWFGPFYSRHDAAVFLAGMYHARLFPVS